MPENSATTNLNRQRIIRWLLIVSPIPIVWSFGVNIVSGVDPANFCLTLRYGFDLASHRPHPPGYPLLVLLWNIPYLLFHVEPQTALLIVNIVFMMLGIATISRAYKLLWGEQGRTIAMALLAACPLFIYYGCAAEMYVFDAVCSLLTFNAFYSTSRKQLPIYALLFGLSGGLRQSTVIFLIPLAAFLIWQRRKELELTVGVVLISVTAFAICWLVWFIPLTLSVGGLSNYRILLREVTDLRTTLSQNIFTISSVILWTVLASIGFVLRSPKKLFEPIKKYAIPFLLWAIPPVLFFVFQYYSKGYLLIVAPIYFLCAARLIWVRFQRRSTLVICVISVINLLLFFAVPYYLMPVETTFANQNRVSEDRTRTGMRRFVSTFALTDARLRFTEAEMHEAADLVNSISSDSAVFLIDPSLDMSLARCMQVVVPRHSYAIFQRWDTSTMSFHSGSYFSYKYDAKKVYETKTLLLIADIRLAKDYSDAIGIIPIDGKQYLALYAIDEAHRESLRRLLIDLYCNR